MGIPLCKSIVLQSTSRKFDLIRCCAIANAKHRLYFLEPSSEFDDSLSTFEVQRFAFQEFRVRAFASSLHRPSGTCSRGMLSSPFLVASRAANAALTPSSIIACSWALVTDVVVVDGVVTGVVHGFNLVIEADDQAIQTILLGLLEDIYADVDSCETAQEIWLRVQQMMKGSDIGIQEKKANQNGKEVDELKAERLAKTQDPLALMATSNNPYNFPVLNQDQPSFNQNYMQQPMPNPKDITDPTTVMNMALALMAKAFKLNYSTPTNNNHRISSNPHNRQIAQSGMNIGQDKQMQMVGGNGENQFRQYVGQNAWNLNGYNAVQNVENQNGNGNLVAARAKRNAAEHNGNQIRCYNCRGVGHFARNCTVRPRRMDAAYLQPQLLIAQKEEAGIQLQAEEFDLMAATADIDEIEEVNANCILMANLQQASTSGTQTDKASVYDSDGSAEVYNYENCNDNEIFNMFTQKEQYTELLEPIPEPHQVPQNDHNVISEVTSVEQSGKIVEQHPANFEKTRALYDSLYHNLAIEVEKVNTEAAKFVGDFKSLVKEADESLAKHKALELEIERLLRAVVSQDIMSVVQNDFVVDTSNLQTKLKRTKENFENYIIKKENEYAKLWNDWYKKCDEYKFDKILYDKAYKDMQQKIERLQARLGDLKGKKNAHLKTTYKNMFDSIYVSRTQTKSIIASLQHELQNTIYENAKLRAQLFRKVSVQKDNARGTSKNTNFAKQSILGKPPMLGEIHALSKPVTSNSVPTPQESKVVKNDKVIAPGMFRIKPFKTSTEEKHVPNNVRASARTTPITVSQPPVFTKKDVNSDLTGLSYTGLDNTKTRRPHPRSNTKNDRVPSASKSSRSKYKEVKVEEHHRNLLLSKNTKYMSSACNNIKLDSQNVISKVVCTMCKKCLISVNHDVYLCNYVNGKTSHGTIRFGNDHVAAILGFGQFCDSNLEVAFRRNACFVRNLEGVDLLKGDRSTNLYTINFYEMASASRICLVARASSTKSWLWHQRLSHLNFDTINDLARNDLVSGVPKFKYHKEHLCPSCEQGKSKRASHPPKPVPNSRQRLHLLHMDLCGPMRIASINGKRYVLLIVDDYSRYTWVHFLRSKDEIPEVIKTFLKRITVLLHVGISHQMSSVRTPQQNEVVERRNQTLVEAARTMLIFSRAPLFLWAEAIATTCFTQNRSIIYRRFNKTPYELINGKKPDISFFYVFGALCYPKNDRGDIRKLGAKGDIGFFIGYSADFCAYRVYNRRTKKIMETINVSFDELSAMAFEQSSSKPRLQSMTSRQISSGLDLTYAPSRITTQQPTEGELNLLFEAMYDDYIGGQPSATNLKDSSDPTTAMNATLALLAKAFNVNTIPTNNNQRSSLIPRSSQIAQPCMNISYDIKMKMVDDNVGNQVRHNAVQYDGNEVGQNAIQNMGIQIVENLKRLSVVSKIGNQYGNGNVETAPAEGNGNGINGIQSTQEKSEFMAIADAYEETERVKVNCTSEDTLQQVSTSRTQFDNAPVYDSDGSTEGKHTAKTRRPHPMSNSNTDMVPSKSKSSCLSNNVEKIEENHRNPQIPKNQKHMSSKCNNITLAIRNAKSKIICVMCKQYLVTTNHDVRVLNYVNDMNSIVDNQSVNVSIRENQKKHKANAKKLKELVPKEVLLHLGLANLELVLGGFQLEEFLPFYLVIFSTNDSNGENQVVSKSFAVTTADASDKRQQQQDPTSSTSTLATTITADVNFDL
nr:hypothetical protein [Tanacetum cinerariifolium]